MDNLVFSLNATMPIFLTMVAGWVLKKMGFIDDAFVTRLNKFVFKVALPAMLFEDLGKENFFQVWDTKFVVFCFSVTLFCILVIGALSFLWKEKNIQGEFIQASYRSSAAILGMAFIQNIYGNSGMAPLMIFASVPLYNMMAVVVLSVMKPEREPLSRPLIMKTLKGIITNPIILGIVIGMLWSVLGMPMPVILQKTVHNVGVLATPLGLLSMGGAFEFTNVKKYIAPSITAAVTKLVILVSIFLPMAVGLGFRNEKLIAILVMLGSSTTVSSYIMAKNMGHEGILTSNAVMLTTLFSAFTLTTWLFILKSLAFI
ncbi:MAG: AEC family transporter [Clostridiales bacterium]|nr:AEC family transporter [Candidatus Blautia equi]